MAEVKENLTKKDTDNAVIANAATVSTIVPPNGIPTSMPTMSTPTAQSNALPTSTSIPTATSIPTLPLGINKMSNKIELIVENNLSAYTTASSHNEEEFQYLDILTDVLKSGVKKNDRTKIGTMSKFGAMMRFSLRDGRFPLFTTKTVYWQGVFEELVWMLKGCTDSKQLSEKKVKIWDANGSRKFLDSLGFVDRQVGDLGPIYGFQWRHFGAKYIDCKTDYTGQGFDQIADVIHQIKTNPDSRRILFSAWNVSTNIVSRYCFSLHFFIAK